MQQEVRAGYDFFVFDIFVGQFPRPRAQSLFRARITGRSGFTIEAAQLLKIASARLLALGLQIALHRICLLYTSRCV